MRPFSGLSFCDRFLGIDCRPIPSGGFRDLLVGVTNKSRKPPLGIGRQSMPRKRSQKDSPGNGRITEILHKIHISGHGLNVSFSGPPACHSVDRCRLPWSLAPVRHRRLAVGNTAVRSSSPI